MTRKQILDYICQYAHAEKKLGIKLVSKSILYTRSAVKWTCARLYSAISMNPCKNPEDIISEFAKKMDNYACMAPSDSKTAYGFSTAYDTAIDILDGISIFEQTKLDYEMEDRLHGNSRVLQ